MVVIYQPGQKTGPLESVIGTVDTAEQRARLRIDVGKGKKQRGRVRENISHISQILVCWRNLGISLHFLSIAWLAASAHHWWETKHTKTRLDNRDFFNLNYVFYGSDPTYLGICADNLESSIPQAAPKKIAGSGLCYPHICLDTYQLLDSPKEFFRPPDSSVLLTEELKDANEQSEGTQDHRYMESTHRAPHLLCGHPLR